MDLLLHKGTNKRGNSQIYLNFFERKYYWRMSKVRKSEKQKVKNEKFGTFAYVY